jgi:hypothetical protein
MRKVAVVLFLLVITLPFYGQTDKDNLAKYWRYRERLRKRFIVVSDNVLDYGVNIPASDIFHKSDSAKSFISWGDGNNNMSHYLSVLATELWLLKHNHQDYSTTLKELYYAMMALERLDAYSESTLRCKNDPGYKTGNQKGKSYVQPTDINGFMLRDDVSDDFWKKYGRHFDVPNCHGTLNRGDRHQFEEMSQDVIEHTMEGLGLVSKLVEKEYVAGISCQFPDFYLKRRLIDDGIMICKPDQYSNPRSVNFSLWANDIVKRFIRYMQYDGTYLGKVGGLISFTTHWVLVNPVSNKLVLEGNGADGGVAMISNGLIDAARAITGENLRIYSGMFSDRQYKLAFKYPKIFQLGLEDNKTRSLACHVSDPKVFTVLCKLRDNYNPYKTGHFPIYEHFPLMYLAMHHLTYADMGIKGRAYNAEKELYEGLLNVAPYDGPASNCGIYEWSSTSRCLWPENLGRHADKQVEYNGLDYMMLHNLFYIAFGKDGFLPK